MSRNRAIALGLIVVGCILIAVLYAVQFKRQAEANSRGTAGFSSDPSALHVVMRQPHALFRSTRLGTGYGHVVAVPLSDVTGLRHVTELECDRVDFAGGTGVCLTADRGVVTTYSAVVFDARYTPLRTVPLSGIPSRVRVSPGVRVRARILTSRVLDEINAHRHADRRNSRRS